MPCAGQRAAPRAVPADSVPGAGPAAMPPMGVPRSSSCSSTGPRALVRVGIIGSVVGAVAVLRIIRINIVLIFIAYYVFLYPGRDGGWVQRL